MLWTFLGKEEKKEELKYLEEKLAKVEK